MTFTIVKNPSIFRDLLLLIMKEYFPSFNFKIFDSYALDKLVKNENITDLVIIDIDTEIDLTSLIRRYKKLNRKVIIVTHRVYDNSLIPFFKFNLDGYFYHRMEKEELANAIEKVVKGEKYIHPELTPILFNDYLQLIDFKLKRPADLLTRREWEILELLTKGFKNEEIANKLFLTDKTVKNHVSSILKKLKVPDRTNAVIKAFKNRWFF